MKEVESGAEQAMEFETLRASVEALLAGAKNASPDKLRAMRSVIEELTEKVPSVPSIEAKDQKPSSDIDSFIEKWNRGEGYENGKAIGSLWFVRTAEGKVYVLPNPSERKRYAGGEIAHYYDVSQDVKLDEQRLVLATELFVGNEGMGEDDYAEFLKARQKQSRVPHYDIVTRGKFSI